MPLKPPVMKSRLSWGVVEEVPDILSMIIMKRNGEEAYDNVSNIDNTILCYDNLDDCQK